ncbi:MAG: hypothetical protein V7772_17485 [Pseudomonas profundi]|uniref:hypothetical protein n=1 Tax=Pseudomonas profundi TaxID=1981513 RepID=UPI0030030EF9
MSVIRQLAESLELLSEPKPAPQPPAPVTPAQPAANDSTTPEDEQQDSTPPRHTLTAATASPEWRQARDLYINHLMGCRACHASTSRYCATGADLRQQYTITPMERTP